MFIEIRGQQSVLYCAEEKMYIVDLLEIGSSYFDDCRWIEYQLMTNGRPSDSIIFMATGRGWIADHFVSPNTLVEKGQPLFLLEEDDNAPPYQSK